MLTIGITGGVATGKSTVATLFRKYGAAVFSADEAAREVVESGSPVLRQIAEAFGENYLLPDGSLDRPSLGKLIFRDREARARLEAISHPAILARLREQIDNARAQLPKDGIIAVEVPLLYEAGMDSWFDRVVVVATSRDTQIERMCTRRGLPEEEARQRLSAQMPVEEKASRADYTLWNDGTPQELENQFHALWLKLVSIAKDIQ